MHKYFSKGLADNYHSNMNQSPWKTFNVHAQKRMQMDFYMYTFLCTFQYYCYTQQMIVSVIRAGAGGKQFQLFCLKVIMSTIMDPP